MIPLNEVPNNKQLLWFFDDEMTHDLIFIPSGIPHNNNYKSISTKIYDKIILVERATIYNYPPRKGWIEEFFQALLPHSTLIKAIGETFGIVEPTKEYIIDIPAVAEDDGGKSLIIAYHIPETQLIQERVVQIFHLHYKKLKLNSKSQKIKITCLIGSAHVITEVSSIKNQLNNFLKDTIKFNFKEEANTLQKKEVYYNYTGESLLTGFVVNTTTVFNDPFLPDGTMTQIRLMFRGIPVSNKQIIKTSKKDYYPTQGAIVYAYPRHPALKNKRIESNFIVGNIQLVDVDYNYLLAKYNHEASKVYSLNYISQRGFGWIFEGSENLEIEYFKKFCLGVIKIHCLRNTSSIRTLDDFHIRYFYNYIMTVPNIGIHPDVDLSRWSLSRRQMENLHLYNALCVFNRDFFQEEHTTIPLTAIKGIVSNNWLEESNKKKHHQRIEWLSNYFKNKGLNLPIVSAETLKQWINSFDYNDPNLIDWIYSTFPDYPSIYSLDFQGKKDEVGFGFGRIFEIRNRHTAIGSDIIGYPLRKRSNVSVINPSYRESITGSQGEIIKQNIYIDHKKYLKKYLEEMNQNLLLQEIHACLGAGEFAYQNNGVDPPSPAYMNIARRLDYVAKALGVCFELDGSIMSIRQSKHIDQGETIPPGWNFGQFGRNTGASSFANAQIGGLNDEERLGLVYEVKGNRFKINQGSGDEDIVQGGYILVESIPQLIHIIMQDFDRSLGLQTLGSIAIANPNYNPDFQGDHEIIKREYYKYNGLGQLILDLMYLSADTNRHAAQANVGSLKAQAIAGETLAALGVPATEKSVSMRIENELQNIRYPGFNASGQTVADLLLWILQNIAIQNEG